MKAAAILIILLSNQGYWFGGSEGEVTPRWTVDKPMPESVLTWDLMADGVRLADGRTRLEAGKEPAPIRIATPPVRTRTALDFVFHVQDADGKELTKGEARIDLFPSDLLDALGPQTEGKAIVVIDGEKGLPRVLAEHKITHTAVADTGKLGMDNPDIILVGVDQLGGSAFEQAALLGHAEAGSGVLIFRQTRPDTLAGYPLIRRSAAGSGGAGLDLGEKHALLRGFLERDIRSILARAKDFLAVSLPADEPALEIVFWKREAPGKEPVPIDALLLTKAVGSGRVVLCQLPLGDWKSDPRAQLFLANAIDYLLTRPEPTPRPSERPRDEILSPTTVPSITIPPGATP